MGDPSTAFRRAALHCTSLRMTDYFLPTWTTTTSSISSPIKVARPSTSASPTTCKPALAASQSRAGVLQPTVSLHRARVCGAFRRRERGDRAGEAAQGVDAREKECVGGEVQSALGGFLGGLGVMGAGEEEGYWRSFDCVPSRLRPHGTPLRMTGFFSRAPCGRCIHALSFPRHAS